jgi:hypothetical protein
MLAACPDILTGLLHIKKAGMLGYKPPDTKGGDLCRKFKEMSEYRHIPVIIFSVHFTPADENRPGRLP